MAQKRRKFTAQFKFETVMEVLRGEKSVTQICQERDITETLCYKWRDAFFERAPSVFENQRGGKTGHDATVEAGVPDTGDLPGVGSAREQRLLCLVQAG